MCIRTWWSTPKCILENYHPRYKTNTSLKYSEETFSCTKTMNYQQLSTEHPFKLQLPGSKQHIIWIRSKIWGEIHRTKEYRHLLKGLVKLVTVHLSCALKNEVNNVMQTILCALFSKCDTGKLASFLQYTSMNCPRLCETLTQVKNLPPVD